MTNPNVKKLNINDLKSKKLVDVIHHKTIEFSNQGEDYEFDVSFKQLPLGVTEPLYERLRNDEYVATQWLALALVDEDGKQAFTEKEIDDNFIQVLTNKIFNRILGLDEIKKPLQTTTETPTDE